MKRYGFLPRTEATCSKGCTQAKNSLIAWTILSTKTDKIIFITSGLRLVNAPKIFMFIMEVTDENFLNESQSTK